VAYGSYDAELRELIHLLKYEQVLPAAKVLGRLLAQAVGKLAVEPDSVIFVPIPLHSSKQRQRGFNQAELIAQAALKQMRLSRALLATNVLQRHRETVSQIGLTRPQRDRNIRGAFRVLHPDRVAGRTVILIDDVLTTGTTASECARVLLKAGVSEVFVATVARTLKTGGMNLEIEPELETAARAS
jgi:ComF family protein